MCAITLISQIRRQSSFETSSKPGTPPTPAFEQKRSMGPNASLAFATKAMTSASLATSVLTARPLISSATFRAASDNYDFFLQIHCALPNDAKSERSLAEDYQYRERQGDFALA